MFKITQCSVCGAVRFNNKWVNINFGKLNWINKIFTKILISHGYCDLCYKKEMETYYSCRCDYLVNFLIKELNIKL